MLHWSTVSSTGYEDDVTLEHCIPGERVYITHPRGVQDEYFHFYTGVLKHFNIHLPFSDFESDILKTLNVAPSCNTLNPTYNFNA